MQKEMQNLKNAFEVEKQPISPIDPTAVTPIMPRTHHVQGKITQKQIEAPVAAPVETKTKSKKQADADVIEKYLLGFRKDHATATDQALIDEYFHSQSHMSSVDDDETRYLDEQHTLAAVDELFNRWEFTVTPDQYSIFKQQHFDKAWKQYSNENRINLELAQDFVDSLIQPSPQAAAEQEQAEVDQGNEEVLW